MVKIFVLNVISFKTFVLVYFLLNHVLSLKIGAFNVRVFGQSKASNAFVMKVLAKISVRYDILLIQEVRDSKGDAIYKLQQQIQNDHGVTMELMISKRLGRTDSKEQYAFLYRKDRGISLIDSFQFDDVDDVFEREPFVVKFQTLNADVADVVFVALHTAPGSAVAELSNLMHVVDDIHKRWKATNILVMGDLNAACDYVPKKSWPNIAIRQDMQFWWPIDDSIDTTVNTNTHCAYDRFIVAGNQLRRAIVPNSAQVFDFQQHFGLNYQEALSVSDHFPVELELISAHTAQGSSHSSRLMAVVKKMWRHIVDIFSPQGSTSEL